MNDFRPVAMRHVVAGLAVLLSIAAEIGAEVAKRGLRGHKMMKMSMADEAKIHFDPLQSVINPLAINPQRVRHLIN